MWIIKFRSIPHDVIGEWADWLNETGAENTCFQFCGSPMVIVERETSVIDAILRFADY